MIGPTPSNDVKRALNGDGSTLVVGAVLEGSNATGIGGNEADDSALASGAATRVGIVEQQLVAGL